MRHFVRQSIKGRRCALYNQYYKSTISDEIIHFVWKELGVKGNISEILDKNFEFTNKHRKIIENEYDSQAKDYRDIKGD